MRDFIKNDALAPLVAAADQVALENIRARKGGPFGAQLYHGNIRSGAITPIGAPGANAVLATGLASAHAEDRALSQSNIAALRAALAAQSPDENFVLMTSSAESCPACLAKMEVFARTLIHDGLLRPGHFIVAYGAPYQDTKNIAGFNDEPYLEDFKNPHMITISAQKNTPAPVQKMIDDGAHAVIALPDGSLHAGHGSREKHFTLTPEIGAINAASAALKKNGDPEPWNLKGATLYSGTVIPGPMSYAACQWANVTSWINLPTLPVTQEAPDIDNAALFKIVAQRPYNGPGTVVQVVSTPDFANRAQKEWKELLGKGVAGLANYNGIKE